MKPDLDAYLARIGYDGPRTVSQETLAAIHKSHAFSIPYENIDVYLGRPVDQDIVRIFDKIVRSGRGGWCYELNGLLGWALGELGFSVTRHCSGVMSAERGESAMGNHLALSVDLDGRWLVDTGLGDGLATPIPWREGRFRQGTRMVRLEHLSGNRWRYHNHEGAMPPDYDLDLEPGDEARLAAVCADLQSDPTSIFRQNLICQRMSAAGTWMLLGRMLFFKGAVPTQHLIESENELMEVLTARFGITLPDITGLWPKVLARHEELFNEP